MKHDKARRITYTEDKRGEWRYRVQGGNWGVIDLAEEGLTLAACRARIARRWPKPKRYAQCDVVVRRYADRAAR